MASTKIEISNSSNILSVSYDAGSSKLLVEFKNGSLYEYEKVPPAIFDELQRVPSVGSFLHSRVKGYYDSRKLQ